jgi:hypothetical protein
LNIQTIERNRDREHRLHSMQQFEFSSKLVTDLKKEGD